MGLFIIVFNVREYLRAFLSGDGDVLLLFEDSLDFFVLKLLFSFVKSVHDVWDALDVDFGVVFMKLVILYDGFIFVLEFFEIVKPAHELFFFVSEDHFSVMEGFMGNGIVEYVFDMWEVVVALGIQVLVVECVIDEDWEGRLFA